MVDSYRVLEAELFKGLNLSGDFRLRELLAISSISNCVLDSFAQGSIFEADI